MASEKDVRAMLSRELECMPEVYLTQVFCAALTGAHATGGMSYADCVDVAIKTAVEYVRRLEDRTDGE